MEKRESLVKKRKKASIENILLIIIVVAIVIIDQLFKIFIQHSEEITIIPGILNFKNTQNTGAAYGIGSNSTIMYVVTNFIILGVIYKFITTQNEFVNMKFKIFLSFILAGGVSNVIDKIIRGYVIEFIDFSQVINLPVFNIADIFVLIGWVVIAAIFAVFTVKEWRNKKIGKVLKDDDKKE